MKFINSIPVWGEHEENTIQQIIRCAGTADRAALCADGHLGYAVPIGGVVAYKNAISPSAVGFDIACGNKAVRLDISGSEVRSCIKSIMHNVWQQVSFGMGRKNNDPVENFGEFDNHPGWLTDAASPLKDKARGQLGTVGGGNHYVDVFVDELDRAWVGVHFGSRGLGHGIATWFYKAANAPDGMEVDPCVLDVNSDLGEQYITAMDLGGRYAYAGRDWVCSKVADIIGAPIVEEIHNNHNFAWRETHDGVDYWVVRKGSTPAFPGQMGFVGGSMGEKSVILEGVDSEMSRLSMYSTVHGAGRKIGRMQAIGKPAKPAYDKDLGNGKKQHIEANPGRPGLVSRSMMDEWVKSAGIELRGGGVDESPHCYKRLPEVLEHHAGTIRVLHELTPVGVAMASPETRDPYKD